MDEERESRVIVTYPLLVSHPTVSFEKSDTDLHHAFVKSRENAAFVFDKNNL